MTMEGAVYGWGRMDGVNELANPQRVPLVFSVPRVYTGLRPYVCRRKRWGASTVYSIYNLNYINNTRRELFIK